MWWPTRLYAAIVRFKTDASLTDACIRSGKLLCFVLVLWCVDCLKGVVMHWKFAEDKHAQITAPMAVVIHWKRSVNFIITLGSSCSASFPMMATWRNVFDDWNTAPFTTVHSDFPSHKGFSWRFRNVTSKHNRWCKGSLGHVMIDVPTTDKEHRLWVTGVGDFGALQVPLPTRHHTVVDLMISWALPWQQATVIDVHCEISLSQSSWGEARAMVFLCHCFLLFSLELLLSVFYGRQSCPEFPSHQ